MIPLPGIPIPAILAALWTVWALRGAAPPGTVVWRLLGRASWQGTEVMRKERPGIGELAPAAFASPRDAEELPIQRGVSADHTTAWRRVRRYAPEWESWRVDETGIRVKGKLSWPAQRDAPAAAKRFFQNPLRSTWTSPPAIRPALSIPPRAILERHRRTIEPSNASQSFRSLFELAA